MIQDRTRVFSLHWILSDISDPWILYQKILLQSTTQSCSNIDVGNDNVISVLLKLIRNCDGNIAFGGGG